MKTRKAIVQSVIPNIPKIPDFSAMSDAELGTYYNKVPLINGAYFLNQCRACRAFNERFNQSYPAKAPQTDTRTYKRVKNAAFNTKIGQIFRISRQKFDQHIRIANSKFMRCAPENFSRIELGAVRWITSQAILQAHPDYVDRAINMANDGQLVSYTMARFWPHNKKGPVPKPLRFTSKTTVRGWTLVLQQQKGVIGKLTLSQVRQLINTKTQLGGELAINMKKSK